MGRILAHICLLGGNLYDDNGSLTHTYRNGKGEGLSTSAWSKSLIDLWEVRVPYLDLDHIEGLDNLRM